MTELQNELLKDSIIEKDYIIMDNKKYYINASIYDDCYNEGNFIGTFIMKRIEFEYEENIDFKQKEFKFYKSFKTSTGWKEIDYGTFIVQQIEQSDTEEKVKVTAYDYALKFAQPYESNLNYSSGRITLWDVFEEILYKLQITTDLTSFTNSNFIVDSNQFVEDFSYGNVMAQIAGISGNFAHIYNDKMCLIFTNETGIVIEKGQYSEFEDKRDAQPITIVVIEDGAIEGENVSKRWEEGILRYGENYLKITGNLFAFTQEKRQQLITALFEKLKGFSYSAMKLEDCLFPELRCGDKIKIRAKDNTLVDSIVLRWQNTDYSHTLEAPSVIKATVKYENPESVLDVAKRTEVIVNKQNQTIESVVSQTTEQNNKINRMQQTVDELNSKISDVADITTSLETTNGRLEFENINQSEPIHIEIRPIEIEGVSSLYPNSRVYPSATLKTRLRKLKFTNTKTEEIWEYKIPDNLYYYDENNYDSFVLDYDSQTVFINKKCKLNADGTIGLLEQEIITEYEYPRILLTDGDYRVEILKYKDTPYTAYLMVRLMVANIYTTQFATKAELSSEINQTKKEVDISVSEKLTSYPTTQEMNSAINVKANEINLKVEKKVDEEEFTGANIILNINDDISGAMVEADKVSLKRKRNKFNIR
jgi:uncharacterized coiled-coil protein SlyX